jgi:hypothetical protein
MIARCLEQRPHEKLLPLIERSHLRPLADRPYRGEFAALSPGTFGEFGHHGVCPRPRDIPAGEIVPA